MMIMGVDVPVWLHHVLIVVGGLVIYCFLVAAAFSLTYGIRSSWRSSALGRVTLWVWLDMAALLGFATLTWVFRLSLEIRGVVALILYSILAVSFTRKFALLLAIQRDAGAVMARDNLRILKRTRKDRRRGPSEAAADPDPDVHADSGR